MSDQKNNRFSVVQGRRGEFGKEAAEFTSGGEILVNPQVIKEVDSKAPLKVVEGRLGSVVEKARVIAFPARQLAKKTIFEMLSWDGRRLVTVERL